MSGQLPVTKESQQGAPAAICWLDWHDTDGMGQTARLNRLTAWLIEAERLHLRQASLYGLRLPGITVDAGHGVAHLHHCLDELTRWGTRESA